METGNYDPARISSFINSFNKDDEGYLGTIYEEALRDNVPVIRRETRELLKVMMLMRKPARILEIGTAVGYSALYMSRYASCHFHITTLELDTERAETARKNIETLGMNSNITVINGDAGEILKEMADKPDDERPVFDMVFVDAAKAQYIYYLESIMKLTRYGSLIISDNVLQEGDILESHFLVTKRDRTIHDRMREYLYAIKNDERLETSILSVGDGVALSYRVK